MKRIKYFLNGKEVTKSVITDRAKKKLTSIDIITEKYYESPLTEEEENTRRLDAINSSRAFQQMRELREDSEKYHG